MDDTYLLGSWIVDEYDWVRMALPLAALMLCSLPTFVSADNPPVVRCSKLNPASQRNVGATL